MRVYRNLNFQNIRVSQKDKPSFDAKDSVPISAGDIILLLSAVSKYAFLFKSITVQKDMTLRKIRYIYSQLFEHVVVKILLQHQVSLI